MSKTNLFLLPFLFVFIISGCKKEFDVYLSNDTQVLNYNTECGSIKLEVYQLRNESFTLTCEFNLHDTIMFNKDSIIVKYNDSLIHLDIYKWVEWPKFRGVPIEEPSIVLSGKEAIIIGFFLRNVNFNYPDTIHVYAKGALYCKGKPIVDFEKINLILKKE